MRKILFMLILITLLLTTITGCASSKEDSQDEVMGRIYYVSPDGDDSNPGTMEKPWRNPSKVVKRLLPGDTLVFLSGNYIVRNEDEIIKPPSGSENASITLKAVDGGKVIILGCDNVRTAFDISGGRYIVLEGFEITHAPEGSCSSVFFRDGIEALGNPVEHVVIRKVKIHHLDEFGLNVADAFGLEIVDSTFTHCGFGGIGGPEGNEGGWRNVLISNCYMGYSGWYYQNGNEENNPYDRPDGIGIEPSDGPVEISDCLVEHNKGDGIDSKAMKTFVHHCIVRNNSCDGVKVWGTGSRIENTLIYGKGDGNPSPSPWGSIVIDQIGMNGATFTIINVTVHDPVNGTYPIYFGYDTEKQFSVLMRNTIILGDRNPVFVGEKVNFHLDHSLIYIPNSEVQLEYGGVPYTSEMIESGEIGDGNISRDPRFINPVWGSDLGDYHLHPDSPAVDSGNPDGSPKDDLDHLSRPRGENVDMGAYER